MHPLRHSYVGLWSVACAFLLTVGGIAAYLVERGKADALELGKARAVQAASNAETLVNRTFLSIDVLLAGLGDLVLGQQGPYGAMDSSRARRTLAGVVRRNLLVRDVVLVTGSGGVVASALPVTGRLGLVLPDGLLNTALHQSPPSMVISQPSESFNTAETVVYFVRPFGDSQGHGLLAVAVVPATQVSAALFPGDSGALSFMTLERDDGQLIVGMPQTGLPASRRLAPSLAFGHRDGVARLLSGRIDGAPSIVAARSLLHKGLLVTVSIPMSVVLSGWQEDRQRIWTVAAVLGLAILATAAALHFYVRRLHTAREAIAEAKTWLDQALASIRDGLLLCDAGDRVVAWNQRYLDFYPWLASLIRPGVQYETLVQRSVDEMFAERSLDEREELVRARLAAHRKDFSEFEHPVRPDLVIRTTESSTPAGGVVSVFRDVTAAERELARAEAAQQAAEESRLHFVGALTQAVAKPASTVLGVTGLLLRTRLSNEQQRCVDWARNSGREILSVVHDLLDLTVMSPESVRIESERFDPCSVVREAISDVQHAEFAATLHVELQGCDGMPPLVWGDAGRTRQAIRKLLHAAARIRGGARAVELSVHAEPLAADAWAMTLLLKSDDLLAMEALALHLQDSSPPSEATTALRVSAKLCELMGGGLSCVGSGDGATSMLQMRLVVKRMVESVSA
jgi:signal transduction histidine kinase